MRPKRRPNPEVCGAAGMEVCVHYTGTYLVVRNRSTVLQKGKPFTFELGAGLHHGLERVRENRGWQAYWN